MRNEATYPNFGEDFQFVALGGRHDLHNARIRRSSGKQRSQRHSPRSLAPLPTISKSEGVDWRIILSAIALSLLAAQSSFAQMHDQIHANEAPSKPVLTTSTTKASAGVSRFAQTEITRYEEVIAAVTERAEEEQDPRRLKRYEAQIKQLSHELDLAKKAQRQWQHQARQETEPFARENLKESIQALQESGSELLDEMIAADRQTDLDESRRKLKNESPTDPRSNRNSATEGRTLGQQ